MKKYLTHPVFEIISGILEEDGRRGYVIGGFVRDLLLSRPSKDIDVVVTGSGIEIARKVAKKLGHIKVSYFQNFGTAMIKHTDYEIEFVGARKESYRRNSRKPIVEEGSLEDDMNRRDFTINAIAISLNRDSYGELIDPFHGISDLEKKLIRTPLDPDITYSDDPLRMLRAIRFAAQLEFNIEEPSLLSIKNNRERLKIISGERILDEIQKILMSRKPSTGFLLMDQTEILQYIFPELHKMKGIESVEGNAHKDNFIHTLQVVDQLAKTTDNIWLLWAGLLHDIAKPDTKRYDPQNGWTFYGHEVLGSRMVPAIFERLKLPLDYRMKYVRKLIRLHLRPIVLSQESVTDSAIRRLLFDAGDTIDDLMFLCEADITSKNDRKVKQYLMNFRIVRQKLKEIEEKDAIRNFQPPVTGEIIMKTFEISPCKEIGTIKNAIKEAILEGEIHNNYQEAYDYMLKVAGKLGLKKQNS